MKTKIVISTLIAAFVFASFIGCTLGPVEIEEITVCKNVDSSAKPIEPIDTFPSGTQAIYISVKINNMTPEDKITAKLNYLETGEEISTTDVTTDKSGSGYMGVGFNLTNDQGFQSGRYNAMVYLNNELIETVEFSVE
ncbi:MAG: hypothetical protein FJW63_01210 [Actinobacteria bacterium]|nr:hypothetical protein [Actinomycetota bacterium]